MGDQPIPGQDEDIFLGTNLYDFFFLNLIIVRIRSARLPEQRYVRWFYFFFTIFFGSFTRNFRLPHCTSEFSVILFYFFRFGSPLLCYGFLM